jgi:uncharacterized membrane protein YcfT
MSVTLYHISVTLYHISVTLYHSLVTLEPRRKLFFFLESTHFSASVRAESVGKSTFQLPGNCTSK